MRIGKWIAKNRILILIAGILLIVPSLIGLAVTKVNYDLLSYLPETLETVNGQNIMVDEYGMGAFAMIVTEGMPLKDVDKTVEIVSGIDHVKKVLWYGTIADISVPTDMLPERLRNALFNGDATLLIAFIDDTTSSDAAMGAYVSLLKEKVPLGGTLLRRRETRLRVLYAAGVASLRALEHEEVVVAAAVARLL